VFEIIKTGGWLMVPILLSSIVALAIVLERFWSLQKSRVAPDNLVAKIWQMDQNKQLDDEAIQNIHDSSPLGKILAIGLKSRSKSRAIMRENIEEAGRYVSYELRHFLTTLGTIAAISPLLGLLGTVVGMIQVFSVITTVGVGDPGELAGGISKALITTAAGISVAIPCIIFARLLRRKVEGLVVEMEAEAVKLVEVMRVQEPTHSDHRPRAKKAK
jgi:biopolymer transport protein ExbB